MTGLTAYAGLHSPSCARATSCSCPARPVRSGRWRRSSPSSAGHTVVGSAGSPEKVAVLLGEMGLDARVRLPRRHRSPSCWRRAAPDGIDVYFDNVGGEHLEAAIGAMRVHGRIPMCGSIAGYNTPQPGPRNIVAHRGEAHHDPRLPRRRPRRSAGRRSSREAAPLIASGSIVVRETIVDGLEHAPQAFIDLLRGANTGKMLVRLSAGLEVAPQVRVVSGELAVEEPAGAPAP